MSHRARPFRPPTGSIDPPAPDLGLFQRSGWPLVILAVLEVLWLGWFLVEPLPNAPTSNGTIRRGLLALHLLPGVVPGVTFRDSLLGKALGEFSDAANLPQRLPIVAAAGLIVLAAVGLGDLILRRCRMDDRCGVAARLAIDYMLGTVVLGLTTLIVGRIGIPGAWVVRLALLTVGVAGAYASKFWSWTRVRLDAGAWTALAVVAPFALMMILGSMLPAIDFDVLEYHLQGPKEYYEAGRIAFLPHNVYTNMPFGVEMLHLLGMEVMGDWWWGGLTGQLLVAFFGLCAAILIASTANRLGGWRAGCLAGLIYLTTPWIYRLGVIAYVEGPLCGFQAALLWAFVRGRTEPEHSPSRLWAFLGFLAGGATACKYTAVLPSVIPFGVLSLVDAWRGRSLRPVVAFVLGWSVVMGPWMIKNVIDTGNPVYPLAYRVFGGRDWTEAREAQWTRAHGPRPASFELLRASVVDVAGRSDWQSPLYTAFIPLVLLNPRARRIAGWLGLYLAWMFLSWWMLTHRLDRFWLPMLPAAAVLAGLGADWSKSLAWRVVRAGVLTLGVATNLVYSSTALSGLNEWTGDLEALRADIPHRLNAPLAKLDAELPSDAKILLVGQAAVYHLRHSILYNTVFNPETIETMASGRTAEEFRQALHDRRVSHVYVDWKEINRHRHPAGYGFTDFVTPDRFAAWVSAGVLSGPISVGMEQDLYEVR
ncbi:ArnT family glycosyltransferase [Paludisphaera rhizosphaerae]|uniref:ArnT family glycosyltransferase n=1 Tax=Paludisphaera rhizosphaerae TaxID=2711216 RepID=UPI0013EA503A|nr:glycosyltransferase family 39 protein [Paludisphaera rhizosphaerae]